MEYLRLRYFAYKEKHQKFKLSFTAARFFIRILLNIIVIYNILIIDVLMNKCCSMEMNINYQFLYLCKSDGKTSKAIQIPHSVGIFSQRMAPQFPHTKYSVTGR